MGNVAVGGPAQVVSLPDISSATVINLYQLLMWGEITGVGDKSIKDVKKKVAGLAENLGIKLKIIKVRIGDDNSYHGSIRVRSSEEQHKWILLYLIVFSQ